MNNRHATVALGAMVALLGASGPLHAQQAQSTPPNVRSIDFSVSGEALYDSNVADSNLATAQARGIQTLADEVFTPTAALNVNLPVGRGALFLQSSAGYDFYRTNTILNRERINVLGGVGGPTGPCRESVTGGWTRNQSDLADLTDLVEPVARNVESHESVNLNAACGRVLGLSPSLTVGEAWDDNTAVLRQALNYRSFSASGGLAYQRPAFGQLSAFFDFDDTAYPNQYGFQGFDLVTGGYDLYAGGVRYDRRLGARIEGVVSLSYTDLRPVISSTPGFSGFTYSADLTYRASARLQGHLNAYRATVPSVSLGSAFSVNDEYLAEAIYGAGPRLKLNLGVSSLHKAFAATQSVFLFPIVTDETTYDVYGSATYTLNRRLSFILDLRHEQRYADLPEFNYASERVGLTVRGTF